MAFTYYGISLNIAGFGLNPFLTQFVFASIEMPMKIGVYFFLEKIGRRHCEMTALLSAGICIFVNIFISKGSILIARGNVLLENVFLNMKLLYVFRLFVIHLPVMFVDFSPDKWIVRTIVAVLGKSMSEASFTIIFLYTTELYPTVVRSVKHL